MTTVDAPAFDEPHYREFFQEVAGNAPYNYQVETARTFLAGRNIVLRAPTGAGKTWAVLVPFLYALQNNLVAPRRLIYALPLRSLAQGIYAGAKKAAAQMEPPVDVTLQTGEEPGDPYFSNGAIIVTTYDQVLSGLLHGPYGLSNNMHNLNAAAVVGALVVFDEFHLMPPQRAFLTAVAGLHLYRDLCQSVWMTATATQPLTDQIRDALGVAVIPGSDEATTQLHDSLPSVKNVTRHVRMEQLPLTADAILQHTEGRSLVLLNTVGRAQEMFIALRERMAEQGLDIPITLLHSRFFKKDRDGKEKSIRDQFGKTATGPAILVATQVIEAGLDLSSDHLHTELCPMNSLVQRAGRCARFPKEEGTIHVYPLPEDGPSWLPYGNLREPDATLIATKNILLESGDAILTPSLAAAWVQAVHSNDDASTLSSGWWSQLIEIGGHIHGNAIQGRRSRIAHLIRGDDTNNIRVIIGSEQTLPLTPAKRDGLSLSRWSLAPLLRNGRSLVGWYWSGENSEWQLLRSVDDLTLTYVVCLSPSVAAYDGDVGLRLGIAGSEESPERKEPDRSGWGNYKIETWPSHARGVAGETDRRLVSAGIMGFLGRGFQRRYADYGLTPHALREAAWATGVLHDLGKLQEDWQNWANSWQQSLSRDYKHTAALAHTDFNRNDPAERARERDFRPRRPHHASASGYYARGLLDTLLPSATVEVREPLKSACIWAILSHHGARWETGVGLNPPRLWQGWEDAVKEATGVTVQSGTLAALRKSRVEDLLEMTGDADNLLDWWPLVAYLVRTLRLSDWHATAEGASDG